MTREFLRPHVRTAFDYVAALALAGLALFLSRTLAPQGPPLLPLSLALVAVLASAALGSAGAALLAAAVLAAGIDYFFLLPTGRFKLPGTTAEIAAFGAFAVAALLGAWLSHTARRARRDRARSSEVAARVAVESDRRDALLALTERALAGGSMEAIGREALALMAASLNVKYGAIVELTSDHDLIVTSTIGWDAGTLEGVRMSADADSHLGYALHAREPIVIADAEIDTRFSLPPEVRARGARSGVAARIAGSSGLFGAVVVYETASRRFEKHDTQFLAGITAVLAGVYERKRLDVERIELAARDRAHRLAAELAYKRSAFLAQTATVFDAALEPDATLVSLARLAVPALADCAIVDLVHDDGHVRRVEVVDIDPTRRDESQMLQRQAPSVRSETPFSRAIRTGQPALLSRVRERDPDAHDPEHEQLIRRLQCQSLLLIPLVARGQTLGLLTLAARERRYDAEDLGVAQDLSARAAIALDNSRLYREAQAAAHAKDEFLAMVSHELRTPMNAVLGWATILRQQPLDESRAQHAYAAIERSARAQSQFLEQLQDVSRAISGKLELHREPTSIGALLDAAIDTMRPDAHASHVRIVAAIDHAIPPVILDAQRLQQVVLNMLANAVKFSPDGGLVRVALRRDDRFVEIVVADQGIGIKREFLPYVFERFRQGGAITANGKRGLGLGMSIARDIIDRHGGTITADSAGEGKGATFTVRLPFEPAPELTVGVPPGAAESDRPSYPLH
jgi:signal transduction histidine kinase